jgi:iron complex outermembrane receptor protein
LSNDGGIPHIVSPLRIENHMNGRTYGVELYASWRASDFANFSATYTHMQVDVDRDPLSMDPLIRDVPRRNANNQASLRAHFNLPWDLEFDTILYYVDSIPAYAVSSYLRTDARLAWNIKENLALELIGQNLFDPTHREYGTRPTEVDRAYFGRVTYRFK